jgi:hypothetical protein
MANEDLECTARGSIPCQFDGEVFFNLRGLCEDMLQVLVTIL